jgi:hypothetical protein
MADRIVFLDVDGVLATKRSYVSRQPDIPYPDCLIDRDCVMTINVLFSLTKPLVVVSSSWRQGTTKEQFERMMQRTGIAATLHRDWCTKVLYSRTRGDEIADWLHKHPDVAAYVCLDDDDDFLPGQPLVKTDFDGGFQAHHVAQAVRFLTAA